MSSLLSTIRGLIAYTIWADRTVLADLGSARPEDLTRETGTSFHTLLGTMAHILGSEQLWLSRFLGIPLERIPNVDDYPTIESLTSAFEDFWPQLEFFLASLSADQLERDFTWTNLAGETHTAPFRTVLLHFANHATYHRGQIVSLLRQLGYIPPHTDLVYFRGAH